MGSEYVSSDSDHGADFKKDVDSWDNSNSSEDQYGSEQQYDMNNSQIPMQMGEIEGQENQNTSLGVINNSDDPGNGEISKVMSVRNS